MSLERTMLPVPKDGVTSQECVEGNQDGRRTAGTDAEVATNEAPTPGAEVAREERAPLLQVRAVEPRSISVAEGPWPSPRSSVEESIRLSSHFLNIISDY